MRILFLNGEMAGQARELTPPGISIGRETDNDVQILAGGLSRYHAKFEFSAGSWIIRDLGSTNGTKVNGERMEGARPARHGDIVIMGDQTMRIEDGAPGAVDTKPQMIQRPESKIPLAEHNTPTLQEIQLPPIDNGPKIVFQPAPAPEQQAKEQPKEEGPDIKAQAKNLFDSIRSAVPTKLEGDIFGKSKFSSIPNANAQNGQANGANGRRGLGNIVFYVAVLGLAVICLCVFIMMQQQSAKNAATLASKQGEQPQAPFMLVYEKQKVGKDNIFRFELTVENGAAIFVLDDLQHNRHFKKSFGKANPVFLKNLEEAVRKSDFMKLQQEPPGVSEDGTDDYRSLTIFQGGNFNKVVVRNTYAKSSFEDIEMAADQFAEDFGLKTVSLSVEEMKDEAEKAFLKAESLFDNYQARPENLRNAISRYQLTLDYLDQFEPKPKEWDVARKRQQEAQTIMNNLLKEVEFSFDRNLKLKDYKAAITDCQKMMDMSDPQDKRYQVAHDTKIKLEKIVRRAK